MAVNSPPPPASPVARRRKAALCLVGAALIAGLFFATARVGGNGFFSREPGGYYGLLTAGFREGHLYAKLAPHPGLLALQDPYDPVANAPYRVHDMSLWRGHYYLYYGVTPAVLFFWPVAAATGWYPTEPLAVAFFCAGGFLAAFALLAAVRRRHFPTAPAWVLAAGGLCLAVAGPMLTLTAGVRFYEVPISCAVFLHLLMFGALYRAWHSARHSAGWLAAASLLLGLAVGARPDYAPSGLALLAFGPELFRRAAGRGRAAWLRLGLAAVGPVALCGFGLLAYNRLRFGSAAEFGWHYQLAGQSNLHDRPFDLANFAAHARKYLWGGGYWQRYFPFFAPPGGDAYGLARYLPWSWLALAAFWPPPSGGPGERRGLFPLVLAIFLCAAGNGLLLFCFQITTSRYMADYVPSVLLLAGIGALSLAARRPRRPALVRAALGAAAAFSVLVGLAVYATVFPDPGALSALARFCDQPAARWERITGHPLGGLKLDLKLREGRPGLTEPIFETGVAPDCRDWLQLTHLGGHRAQLGFFHAGLGLLPSRVFDLPPDGRLSIEVRCGSLLPPFQHPVFAAWTPEDYEQASRDLRIAVDGHEVLRAALGCYPAPPQYLRIGTRGWIGDGVEDHFSGEVRSWRRLPLERPAEFRPILHRRAPVDLTVLFPADRSTGQEPLLAVGNGPLSDLLYCRYEGPGRARLALDHANAWGPEGELFTYDPTRPCRIRIWMGSLADPASAEAAPGSVSLAARVIATAGDAVVLNAEAVCTPAGPESVRTGVNPFASTAVARNFTGLVLGLEQPAELSVLPALRFSGEFGAVDLQVLLPEGSWGRAEPLVVTGAAGAGDLLYIKYEDAAHVSFGFDHWGVGGGASRRIEADYSRPHRFEITLGSLYPAGVTGAARRRLQLKMDGTAVLEGDCACYPTRGDQIQIGRNLIGASTCGPAFTGRILSVARTEPLSD